MMVILNMGNWRILQIRLWPSWKVSMVECFRNHSTLWIGLIANINLSTPSRSLMSQHNHPGVNYILRIIWSCKNWKSKFSCFWTLIGSNRPMGLTVRRFCSRRKRTEAWECVSTIGCWTHKLGTTSFRYPGLTSCFSASMEPVFLVCWVWGTVITKFLWNFRIKWKQVLAAVMAHISLLWCLLGLVMHQVVFSALWTKCSLNCLVMVYCVI